MNRMSAAAMVAIVLWGATILAPMSHAQEGGQAPAQSTAQTLDKNSLQTMLSGLGYEPKELTKGLMITCKKDSWTYYIDFVLSSDGTKLGMTANLGKVDDPEGITAAQWRTLLAANEDIDPSMFYFDKDEKKLFLHRALDNRYLTASYLRDQIDNFTKNIYDTKDDWNFTK